MISVRLDQKRCKGCTTCIKQCPTEAIRVRQGHAIIISERCIDCGQCVRVCPHHAKIAVADTLSHMQDFTHTIALPAPAFYGQFTNLDDVNIVLQALLNLGFSEVFEAASAAEMITVLTAESLNQPDRQKPLLSSACPSVLRLISQRFPNLIPNVHEYIAPVELAAKLARERAITKTGLSPDQIGVFFISPCPAKVTEAHQPCALAEPVIDYVLSMSDIYLKLLPLMKKIKNPPPLRTACGGIKWATIGGEALPLTKIRSASVDGLKHIIDILSAIEDDMLTELDYLELNACAGGCVGGCLTVENPYAAASRIRRLADLQSESDNTATLSEPQPSMDHIKQLAQRTKELSQTQVNILDPDFKKALKKMQLAEELKKRLPGLDCSACGTPGCHALAEDVVQGYADESDCIFNMRDRMSDNTIDDNQYLPPPFRRSKEEKENA